MESEEVLVQGVLKEFERWITKYHMRSERLDSYLYGLINIFVESPDILVNKLKPELD